MVRLARGAVALLGSAFGVVLMAPIVLGLLVSRALTALTGALARGIEPPSVDWPELLEFEPELGWKPRPSMNVCGLSVSDPEVFRVVTDEEGWPGHLSLEESDLVVVGDSFAFGYSIDFQYSYAAVTPGLKVKPIAAPGYSMVHGLILMKRMRERLRNKPVVWMIYYGNDLIDNLVPRMNRYRTPFVTKRKGSEEWEVVAEHVNPTPWRASGGKGADRVRIDRALHEVGPFSERAFSACEFLIKGVAHHLRDVGADLTLLTIPSGRHLAGRRVGEEVRTPDSSRVPDEAFSRIGESAGVHVVHGSQFLTTSHFRPTDPHWNLGGHQRIAREIAAIHQNSLNRAAEPFPHHLEAPLV